MNKQKSTEQTKKQQKTWIKIIKIVGIVLICLILFALIAFGVLRALGKSGIRKNISGEAPVLESTESTEAVSYTHLFKIASEDLKLRGPGDFFGIRQSGEMQFALADIYQDAYIMQRASEEVADILGKDPELSSEDHKNLKDYLELFLADQRNKLNL